MSHYKFITCQWQFSMYSVSILSAFERVGHEESIYRKLELMVMTILVVYEVVFFNNHFSTMVISNKLLNI